MLKASAKLMGWHPIDVLGAFLTDDGKLIVIDRENRRLEGTLSGGKTPMPTVPSTASLSEHDHLLITQLLEAFPDGTDRDYVIKRLEATASEHNVRAIELVRMTTDTPDWRDDLQALAK